MPFKMTEKTFFPINLKLLRERKGKSQKQLADALNIKRTTLAAYEIGQTKNPPLSELIGLSEHFNIPIDIMTKVDISKFSESRLQEIENNKSVYTGKEMRVIVTTVDSSNKDNIEFIPEKAKAGYLRGYNDPDYISKLPVFNLPHLPRNKKYRMFPTEGDSMYPFPENIMVIGEFVENWYSIKNEDLCVVITQNEGIVFKQLMNHMNEDGSFIFQSLNPIYKPYKVAATEICEIWKYNSYMSGNNPKGDISLLHLFEDLKSVKSDVSKILGRMSG